RSDRQPPQREHAIAVLGEVTSAGVAAEIQGLSVDVGSRARVLDPKDGAAHGAIDQLTELGARLRDGLRVAAAESAHALAAAGERNVHRLPGFEPAVLDRRLRSLHR